MSLSPQRQDGPQTHALSKEVTKQLRPGQHRSSTYTVLDQRTISRWERHWWVFSQVRQKEMKEWKRHKDESKTDGKNLKSRVTGQSSGPEVKKLEARKEDEKICEGGQ